MLLGFAAVTSALQAQTLIGHLVAGTVRNPDYSLPDSGEVQFRAYLLKAPTDTSLKKVCSDSGGWAIMVDLEIPHADPNVKWIAGDTVVVLFENIKEGATYIGAKHKLIHKTTEISPEFVMDVALPVELTAFMATTKSGSISDMVILDWKTNTESNNLGFEIQKSADGKAFDRIGFVAGSGTTNAARSYSFSDKDVRVGKYYYRLKQLDTDGTFSYSDVIDVTVAPPQSFELAQNFPNPFNPQTDIVFRLKEDTRVTIRVFDVLGREVVTLLDNRLEAGSHRVVFDGKNLPSGMYLYSMKAGNFHAVKKMALIK